MKVHGDALRIRRMELGMSLEDVMRKTDIDRSNLSKLERGVIGAHLRTVRKLAVALDLPMDQIVPELAALKAKQT
jgi:transcriptional regulator with XRE-family HTH domain